MTPPSQGYEFFAITPLPYPSSALSSKRHLKKTELTNQVGTFKSQVNECCKGAGRNKLWGVLNDFPFCGRSFFFILRNSCLNDRWVIYSSDAEVVVTLQ